MCSLLLTLAIIISGKDQNDSCEELQKPESGVYGDNKRRLR